jgi:transcriptional regulator with XRE-family HTH domain
MTAFPDDQDAFSDCIYELVKSLPESKRDISANTGVSVVALNNLLSAKGRLPESDLQRLYAYFNCTYDHGLNNEDGEFHRFSLSGGYTVFPKSRKRIVELYDSVSHGGDLVFAYHLVHHGGYVPNHTRYLLLHTCFDLYTLMIIKDEGELVDRIIESNALINFCGDRIACPELFRELEQHEYRIACEPMNRRAIDAEFFEHKELVFAQLAPSCIAVE